MLTLTLLGLASDGSNFLPKPIDAFELHELLDRSQFVFRGIVAELETEVILHPVRSGKIGVAVVDIEEMFVGEVGSGRVRLNIVATGLGYLEASNLAPGDEILTFASYRRGTCAWDCESYEPVEGEGPMVPLSDSLVPSVESWVVVRREDGISVGGVHQQVCFDPAGSLTPLGQGDYGHLVRGVDGIPPLVEGCLGREWEGWLPLIRKEAAGRAGGSIPGLEE